MQNFLEYSLQNVFSTKFCEIGITILKIFASRWFVQNFMKFWRNLVFHEMLNFYFFDHHIYLHIFSACHQNWRYSRLGGHKSSLKRMFRWHFMKLFFVFQNIFDIFWMKFPERISQNLQKIAKLFYEPFIATVGSQHPPPQI